MAILSNDFISIEVKPLGAELVSLKKVNENYEYIWSGNAEFWTGQSPVLFPIIGSVQHGKTKIKNAEYAFANHGFARKMHFELIFSDAQKLVFALRYNEVTLTSCPYKFELRLIYTLEGSEVRINYEVENLDHEAIYFQLGTHPGFNCPMSDALEIADYYLQFQETETATRYYCAKNNFIIAGKEQDLLNATTKLALSWPLFYDGALIFRKIRSKSVTLKSDKDPRFVRVSWENFPYLGLWQPQNAPFVCIEPWHGLTEADNSNVEFKDKEKMVCLAVGETFKAEIRVEV